MVPDTLTYLPARHAWHGYILTHWCKSLLVDMLHYWNGRPQSTNNSSCATCILGPIKPVALANNTSPFVWLQYSQWQSIRRNTDLTLEGSATYTCLPKPKDVRRAEDLAVRTHNKISQKGSVHWRFRERMGKTESDISSLPHLASLGITATVTSSSTIVASDWVIGNWLYIYIESFWMPTTKIAWHVWHCWQKPTKWKCRLENRWKKSSQWDFLIIELRWCLKASCHLPRSRLVTIVTRMQALASLFSWRKLLVDGVHTHVNSITSLISSEK